MGEELASYTKEGECRLLSSWTSRIADREKSDYNEKRKVKKKTSGCKCSDDYKDVE